MTDATSPVPPPTTKWQVNDPITVSVSETDINNDSEESLEGVVSFLGRVRELEEDGAGEEDWIAVRLTGKSVGKGSLANCLLSVQQTYWEPCPPNCAMMVRSHQVARRTLTRLEELRLRRELASSSASTTTSTATTTASAAKSTSAPTSVTASSSTDADVPNEVSKSTAAAAAAAAQMTPPRSSVPAVPGTRSKLEELKLRREALMLAKQRQKQQQELLALDSTTTLTSPSPKSRMATPLAAAATSAATTTADHSVVAAATDELIASLKSQVDTFTLALSNKDQENQQLRERLTVMEEQSSNQTRKVQTLQIQLEAAKVVTPPVETPTKALLKKSVEEVQQENELLQSTLTETRDELEASLGQLAVVQSRLTAAEQGRDAALTELTASKAQITLAHNQTKALSDQSDARGGADATHYKERAKLVADASTLRRKIEQMEAEKMELEATIEDITLDKEQLQEEKEALEDKNEEIKLDLDTAHMELEELRFELQDAQASVERASGTLGDTVTMVAGTEEVGQHDDTTDDMVSALQIQNARLREALIRLREQSTLEKMELTRQLRTLEREAETNVSMQAQNEELVALKQMFEEEINDLKDMVEQGAAFESMVEDLSDRVLALEEDNVALRTVVREMEEAAELTAEMEEVQADELKAMSLDMEGRDAIIRNLEEAIKMQRRREDDFRRTAVNYKATVEMLRQEKKALLMLQQGGEGEKNTLMASSQKALSRAAELVARAADVRKREAEATIDKVDLFSYKHVARRLESLLPQNVVSAELSAMKGEILASKIIGKASMTLAGIVDSFRKSIRPPLPNAGHKDGYDKSISLTLHLSDEVLQKVSSLIHQAEFGHAIAEVSSELIRFLTTGQWPDLLLPEDSVKLGTIFGHVLPELDTAVGAILKTLKEEGNLTVEQSNLGALRLCIQTTKQSLSANVDREDSLIAFSNWNPPGWVLLANVSFAKFSFLGCAAALSEAVDSHDGSEDCRFALNDLYNRIEQCSTQIVNVSLRLSTLDLTNEKLVNELTELGNVVNNHSQTLLDSVRELLTANGDADACRSLTKDSLGSLAKLSLVLRTENMGANESENLHSMSPESHDAWKAVTQMVQSIRAIDGDKEDINYLLRAQSIQHKFEDAVENEPKLARSLSTISTLEKNLSSRIKEIAMMNARLSELENVIAKSSSTPIGRGKNFDFKSKEEVNNIQEENRVLTEAVDVLQREVEMYENEIRALKDFKSPKRGSAVSKSTPRRTSTAISDHSPAPRGAIDESHSTSSLEATLFRPALQQALHEAARWKTSATATAISDLPPLPILPFNIENETYIGGIAMGDCVRLSLAIAESRIHKASIALVDLTSSIKTPRAQLRDMAISNSIASQRLETAVMRYQGRLH